MYHQITFSNLLLICLFFCFCLIGCSEAPAVPKPRTYPRVDFPEKKYTTYQSETCPYTFEVPVYSKIEKDSVFFGEKAPNDCWINVFYPDFNGQLYCSYYPVKSAAHLEELIADGYRIASKHTVKADYIDEYEINKDDGTSGMIFEIEGPAASGLQFFVTDNKKHYFKASLYINAPVNQDSLAPIIDFLKPDVYRMVETFQWQ